MGKCNQDIAYPWYYALATISAALVAAQWIKLEINIEI